MRPKRSLIRRLTTGSPDMQNQSVRRQLNEYTPRRSAEGRLKEKTGKTDPQSERPKSVHRRENGFPTEDFEGGLQRV